MNAQLPKQPEVVKFSLLEGKIQELHDSLEQKRNMRLQLSKELEETKEQLAHRKRLCHQQREGNLQKTGATHAVE